MSEERMGYGDNEDADESPRDILRFERSVSQLLFNYLPDKTVDWEDGAVIVQLGHVRLRGVWDTDRSRMIIDAVDEYLERWARRGGKVRSPFPPNGETGRFAVGEPFAISATFFHTALVCTHCSRLVFRNPSEMVRSMQTRTLRECPDCRRQTLRQFPQVLVHGCGRLDPITMWLPSMETTPDGFAPGHIPIQCPECREKGRLYLPARSERVRDMKVYCATCGMNIPLRLTGRCADCIKEISTELPSGPTSSSDTGHDERRRATVVARVAMRQTRYSASDAYFPHSITLLRTDGPLIQEDRRPASKILRGIQSDPASPTADDQQLLPSLLEQMAKAAAQGNLDLVDQLSRQVRALASGLSPAPQRQPAIPRPSVRLQDDAERAIREALAFGTTVRTRAAVDLARANASITPSSLEEVTLVLTRLGIDEFSIVDDLPVITATFGYSRRSSDPQYEEPEIAKDIKLPTTIRPFRPLDRKAANAIDKPQLVGSSPILAREGKHQGLFFSLNPQRVVDWLDMHQIELPYPDQQPLVRLVVGLEPIDRFYDDIWDCVVRRMVFGVVHSLSHALMRAISRYSGLERTSIAEYVLLPLLGAVVYDASSSINLGAIETAVRNDLGTILDTLQKDAVNCLYDVDCIDTRKGACHGCIHAPEISCRVFNHGLSRAFLLGGHAPWADPSVNQRIQGYWTAFAHGK